MATISFAGTIAGKANEAPVNLKTYENGDTVASFSVLDRQWVPGRNPDDKQGQFYRCEVRGKFAEICNERLQRGDKVGITGQLVQRTWNDKLLVEVKNASVTFLEARKDAAPSGSKGSGYIPF